VTITITIEETPQELPDAAAATLAEELREYANGYRGDIADAEPARQLAAAIERRIGRADTEPIVIDDSDMLDALHRALNSTVDAIGPTMHLYNVVDMARRAA
jgi:hypothetical protein